MPSARRVFLKTAAPAAASIRLERLTIPQVPETYATLGSSPYWCWGYEEGINEFGVAAGNEGIRTKTLADELAVLTAGKAAGSDWDALIKKRILDPLDMSETNTSIAACRGNGLLARGYIWEEERKAFRHLPLRVVDNVAPAGAINSSVLDMAKWLRFQLGRGLFEGRRLISEKRLRET